jgi:thymidylate synthase
MATVIHAATGRTSYLPVLYQVLNAGRVRSPKGLRTLDLGLTTVVLQSPYNALPLGLGRDISRRIAAAEAVQLIGGFSDPRLMLAASKNFARYQEDDGTFWGAYGKRIGGQVIDIIRKLIDDPSTRQAVVQLWDKHLDNELYKRDYPCTLVLGFSINETRSNSLEMDVVMRSNDAWLGYPYDIFQFTQLQLTVARALKIEPGEYRHTTMSMHIYEHNIESAQRLVDQNLFIHTEEQPTGIGALGESFHMSMLRAKALTQPDARRENFSESERWYWHVLRGDQPTLTTVHR